MKTFLSVIVPILILFGVIGRVIYLVGGTNGYREASEKYLQDLKEDRRSRCCSGETQPCVFGPGIVGIRRCIWNTWDKCEPDPSFRIPKAVQ